MSIPQSTVAPSFDRNRNLFAVGFRQYWPLVVTILCGGVLATASAQTNYQRLKSFAVVDFSGAMPESAPIRGSDGALYGTTSGGGSGFGTVYKLNTNGTGYAVLRSFSGNGGDGQNPYGGLVQGSDGALYGTTYEGGSSNLGSVFRLNTDGSAYTILKSFTGSDGAGPQAGLVQGNDGGLYGTTTYGGTNGVGTVFKLNINGNDYTVLRHFSLTDSDGCVPRAGLVLGTDGVLYGTTYYGGTNNFGTVFKLNGDGSGYSVLRSFTYSSGDGAFPEASLVQGMDGIMYGTTHDGGTSGVGTVFKLNTDGTGYAVLKSFAGDGNNPQAGLVQSSDGFLYGTASAGYSVFGSGTVYKLNTNGIGYAVLRSFFGTGGDGQTPYAGLVQDSDGTLFGTTYSGGSSKKGTVFKLATNGANYSVLWSFTGTVVDGQSPFGRLVEGIDGGLYGTTYGGGASDSGTVFKLNKDGGSFTVLRNFAGTSGGADGENPLGGLVQASDEALYGTTMTGGTANSYGTVFKLNADGSGYAVLRSFGASIPDANDLESGLIQGSDGALYGTSVQGTSGAGTAFKLNPNGTGFAVLRSLQSSGVDGTQPYAELLQGIDGFMYGTTHGGGTSRLGTIFKLKNDGSGFTVLRNFSGGAVDGDSPYSGLVQGSDGMLYGTTPYGGSSGVGTVFKLNTNGSGFTLLRSFTGTGGDGAYPSYTTLVKGSNGILYGTTRSGGTDGIGTVFKLNANGSGYTVLKSFSSAGGDGEPSSLMQGSDGALYGTTRTGGDMDLGTVFKLFDVAINQPPVVANPIPDQNGTYGSAFNFTFAADSFSDPDAGQVLSYTADGLPPGITFDGSTRAFSGTPTNAGLYIVTITATDNGLPSLNTNDVFNIVVAKALLTVNASNTNRSYGEANPSLTGTLSGVTNDDNIVALFSTIATPASPPGNYPVIPAFLDPDNRLGNYLVTTNSGTLTVNNVTLAISSINGMLTFSWPTNAGAFLPEYTDDLTPPVLWHPVTDGITTNGANIYLTEVPEVAVPARFYRLQLPACADNNDKLGIFPPPSNPYGKSYGEWAAAFWQWAFALPLDGHPFLDNPNDPYFDFGASQSGKVWFWSSPDGPLTRIVTMPEDKALFLTIRDVETSSLETPDSGFHGDTEAEQRANSKWYADHITNIFCVIDGVTVNNLQAYRFSTPQFEFTAPTPWIFGGPDPDPNVGGTGTSVGDGYFLMIAPMSRGIHEIHYGGTFHFTLAADGFDADYPHDVTINLTITP
jgi:uncharacterized repeat protein (TIGR03803 family)